MGSYAKVMHPLFAQPIGQTSIERFATVSSKEEVARVTGLTNGVAKCIRKTSIKVWENIHKVMGKYSKGHGKTFRNSWETP